MFSQLLIAAASVLAVSAADIQVDVGLNGLAFTPSSVQAAVGDNIIFTFHAKNHTVTQSTLASPCAPLQGGFDTGFVPVDGTEAQPRQAKYGVISTNPVWAYCRQAPPTGLSHCQSGMVFAINSPDDKFQQFVSTAKSGQAAPPAQSSDVPAQSSALPPTSSTADPNASPTPSSSTGAPGAAATHQVMVGGSTLAFSPSSITANVGDVVLFQFYPKNHSVTQSTFGSPCTPGSVAGSVAPGFDSGFMAVADGAQAPMYQFTVNDTKPIWAFCAQTSPVSHCQKGMVFAVNAPTSGNTFQSFQNAAMGLSASASGAAPSASVSSGATLTTVNGAAAGIVGALLALLI